MLVDTLKQLKQRKAAIRSEIAKLNTEDKKIARAIRVLGDLPVASEVKAINTKPAKKRKFSAATRAKMKKAQQARWAKIKTAKAK
jgi:hypothetical protein